MNVVMKLVCVLGFVAIGACGSSKVADKATVVAGKQIPDEQVCREDSPCPNVVGSDEDYQACMEKMRGLAQDECRQALVEQRICMTQNTKCNDEGDIDESASLAAWEAACGEASEDFSACCTANPESVVCATLEH